MENKIKIFENKQVRTLWNADEEEWYFSVVDVVAILTDSPNPRKYWSVLKTRLKVEGSEVTTNCSQLKMLAEVTTTTLSKEEKPETFNENKAVAKRGGALAGETRKRFETETGTKVTTALNAENKPALEQKKKK